MIEYEVDNMIWKDGGYRKVRPIDSRLMEMLDLLEKNQVIIVEAETSAGKTSRIPQVILTEWPDVMVNITQPRRMLVRGNGRWVSHEMRTKPGGTIGWRLFGEKPVVSKNTQCIFRVDQAMVNLISRTGRLPKGVMIVDEAHERSVSIDTLLIMIREKLPNSPETKVIVTSATIDTKKFSEYFDNAPVMSVKGRSYPVETLPRALIKHEHHTSGAISATKEIVQKFLDGELTIQDKDNLEERVVIEQGSVLVLLPGKEDINSAISFSKSYVNSLAEQGYPVEAVTLETKKTVGAEKKIEIFACHSEISSEEQDRSQGMDVSKGSLRIVYATDIARTGGTFSNLVGVVDSLQVKRPFSDRNGVTVLNKISVSRAEANQGKGRAGRVDQCGFYIPIGSEYLTLEKYPTPAILREPLPGVMLQLASVGINPRSCQYIDAPDPEKIAIAIERLVKIGALDKEEKITKIGKLLIQFPLDPEQSRILITADQLGVLSEAVIAGACINNEGIFFLPKRDAEVVVEERIIELVLKKTGNNNYSLDDLPSWIEKEGDYYGIDISDYHCPFDAREVFGIVRDDWSEGENDFAEMVEAYRAYKQKDFELRDKARNSEHNHRWVENELFIWCQRNFLNLKKLRMVESSIKQIKEVLQSSPLHLQNGIVDIRQFDSDTLTKAIASGLIDNIGRRDNGDRYKSPIGDFQKADTSACSNNDLILVGGVRKIPYFHKGKTKHFLLADLAAPIEAEWLEEIMPQFCSFKVDDSSIKYDSAKDDVLGTLHTKFNGKEIVTCKVEIDDERAVKAFAEALVNDKVNLSCADHNKAVREEVKELWRRSAGETAQEIANIKLRNFYLSKLDAVYTAEEAKKLDLNLTDGDVGKILGIMDYPAIREKIFLENPDAVSINGVEYQIKYSRSFWEEKFEASIEIDQKDIFEISLENIPVLPSGRELTLGAVIGISEHKKGTLDELKTEIEKRRLQRSWDEFKIANKDIFKEDLAIGEIKEFVFDTNRLSGKKEIGFAVSSLEHSSDNTYCVSEKVLLLTCDKEKVGKAVKLSQLAKLTESLLKLESKFETIIGRDDFSDKRKLVEGEIQQIKDLFGKSMKAVFYSRQNNYIRGDCDYEVLQKQISEIDEQVGQLIELATNQEEAIESGEVLLDFEAWDRDGGVTNNGHGWVVRPNGLLRERDSDDVPRHKSDGTYHWDWVDQEELALRWHCHSIRDVAGNSTFEVVKLPVNDCTKEQLETVATIEEAIEAPKGAFGLGPEKTVDPVDFDDPVEALLQGKKVQLGL